MKSPPCPDLARELERQSRISAFAQPLTNELLLKGGLRPGMSVLVVGSLTGDVGLLAAERVGDGGTVLGIEADADFVALSRERAGKQCFGNVTFECAELEELKFEKRFDAVIGRFYLDKSRDAGNAVRQAVALVRPGGSVIFQEWDYRLMVGANESLPIYTKFIEAALAARELRGVRFDMGLRLVDAFVQAGLPVPAIRTELCPVTGRGDRGYALLEMLLETGCTCTLGDRLQAEAVAAGVHAYFPLQVGAWSRLQDG